jgi:hypothetical protein
MQIRIRNVLIIMTIPFFSASCSLPVSFNKDIQPILVANCVECHDGKGEGSTASGFSVQNYDSVMKGTKFGPVVVPGSSASSTLYLVVAHKVDEKIQMPPHHNVSFAEGRSEPLTARQIEYIEKWIDEGAKNN